MADQIPTEALEAAVEAIRQRLDDLGVEGRDAEGTLDGSLWFDGLDSVAEDLARTAAPYLIAEGRRQAQAELEQRAQGLLTEPVVDETPALMARYERELRAKIAAEIRTEANKIWPDTASVTGVSRNYSVGVANWAARIAEGTDHG